MASNEEEIDQAFKQYYGSGPLRNYYSMLDFHDAVEDYFAPNTAAGNNGNSTGVDPDSPYTIILKYKQGVEFRGKLIGSIAVAAPSGEEMCRTALAKLRSAVRASKKHKTRVILRFTNREVAIIDQETEEKLYTIRLHKISYILPDPNDDYAFGFVCGEKTGPWTFHGLKTVSPAIASIVAVKELFEALSAISKGNVGPNWDNSLTVLERYKHGIEFRGKYIGSQTVPAPNGSEVCYAALDNLRTQLAASKKQKTRIVLHINNKEIYIIDQEKGITIHQMRLELVTYVIHDQDEEHTFGFIAGEKEGPWTFYGFKTVLSSMAPISVITELLAAIGANARCQGQKETDRFQKIIDHFRQGGVEFRGKFVGCDVVPAPTGDEMSLSTLAKLRAAVKASKVHKTRVLIHLTDTELSVRHQDDGTLMHSTKIRKISYVTADPNDQRAFGFICGELTGPWYFYGFKTVLPSIAVIAAIKDLSEAIAEVSKRARRQVSEYFDTGASTSEFININVRQNTTP